MKDHDLKRLATAKHFDRPPIPLIGPEMISFFKQSVQKRQTKLAKIAETWAILVPEVLNDHCALESFSHGSLTVLVDSASHLYELKQLLLAGIQQQLCFACKSTGLKKINLKPGRWYSGDEDHRPNF